MRLTKYVFASLALAASLAPAAPSTRPAHDREPWIFRCVLDNNARMVVISLGNDVWAAYDTNRCTLAEIWVGDINFTGAVFDTKHGPQPKSRGTQLLDRAILIDPGAASSATSQPINAHVPGYQGYRIEGDKATLNWSFEGVKLGESLALTDINADAKTVTIRRTIKVEGDVSAAKPVAIQPPQSARARSMNFVEGAQNVTAPGTVTMDMTFSTEKRAAATTQAAR